ncbi:hypothetical protein BGX33_008068 [Mortierella sp. NVP41]|nr:hypothetical protein BGX33_008068 [Mortierella sp. NVP41]
MNDRITTPGSNKRKDLEGEDHHNSGAVKKHKKSKKKKNKRRSGDTKDDASMEGVSAEASAPAVAQDASKQSKGSTPQSTTQAATPLLASASAAGSGSSQAPVAPLPTAPKEVTQSVLAFGLLPRQVAKPSANKSRISTTVSSSAGSSIAATATRTTFRARDIMTQSKSSTSSTTSMVPRAFNKDRVHQTPKHVSGSILPRHPHHHHAKSTASSTLTDPAIFTSIATTTTTTTQSSEVIVTSNSTLIKATPLFVNPKNNKDRYEFPYGNYPNYYEKRAQEQSKRRAPPKPTTNPAPTTSTTSSLASAGSGTRMTVGVWDQVWENQKSPEEYHQRKHFRISATPTVLFPAGCLSYSSRSSSSKNKGARRLKATKMPMVDLAKRVDLRLEFLDPTWFRGKRVLDIGCNSALLTVFIALHYKPHKIQGVDIDPSLIGKAQKFVLKTFSQLSADAYTQSKPEETSSTEQNKNTLTGKGKDKDKEGTDGETGGDGDVPYEEYFPRAMQRIHGLLPVPKRTDRTEHLFPHNIELRVADWVTDSESLQETAEQEPEQWDVIIGFSLTKWIHLHHGDEGLKKFFQKVYRNLAPGGIFLVEPQDYATYAKRSKITPEMKETYKEITFRPEEFQDYLVNKVGFRESQHLGQSDGRAKNFNRDIFLYRK